MSEHNIERLLAKYRDHPLRFLCEDVDATVTGYERQLDDMRMKAELARQNEGANRVRYANHLGALKAENDKMKELLGEILRLARARCPCNNDLPKICPLCDANVDAVDERGVCKAENFTLPERVLSRIHNALSQASS